MSETDFSALIEPVGRKLWGEPNKGLSTKVSLRWGSGGSRAIFLDGGGNWSDFETGEKGGVLDLIMREKHVDKAGAIAWLEAERFIEPHREPANGRSAPSATDSAKTEESPPAASASDPQGRKVQVAAYDYVDRDGNVLYQVVREQWRLPDGSWLLGKSGNPKKTFVQRRKDASGRVVYNLDGIGHTIYRHNVIEAEISDGKTIYMPEGEKDVHTLESWGLAATTNSGGAQNWRAEFAEHFRGADVVILGDDDEAGRKRVDVIGASLRGVAKRIRAIRSWGGPKDVTDWKEAGGTAEQFAQIVQSVQDWRPTPPESKFFAVDLKSIGTGIGRKHTWLVQDMIELGGSCALAGFSQSGKSFLTIKLTFAIVMGEQFFGRDTLQGMVVYQLGEGEAGFEKRIEGFMKDKGIESIDGLPLVILPKKINLFTSDDDTDALIAEIKAWALYHDQPCRMVVIDTYNKATRGMNEISGQDNGKVIDRVERISRETGATVMVIDHLSMSGRIRGHGSKTDDMTNTIRVEKDEKKVDNNGRPIRNMILAKNKDGEAGQKIAFVLRQVVNGFDEYGRPITTCVVDPPDGNQEELERSGRLPVNQATILRVLRDTLELEGTGAPEGVNSAGRHVVAWKAFRTMLERKWQYDAAENEPEKRKHELERILKDAGRKLQLAGYIDRDNAAGVIWWTGKTDRPIPKPKPIDPAKPSPLMSADDMMVPF